MKRIFTISTTGLLLCLATFAAKATTIGDSLIIQFANRTKMVIYAPDRAGIQSLTRYDLNKIVRDMGMRLDSLPNGQTTISIDSRDGGRYVRDTVLVITKSKDGQKGKNGKGEVRIVFRGDNDDSSDSSRADREYKVEQGRIQRVTSKKSGKSSDWKVRTDFLVGLNTLLTQSELAAYPQSRYDLRPIGSRFFGISFGQRPTIARGKNARLSIHYGLEFNWNNLMFDNDVTVGRSTTADSPRIIFADIQQASQKSKLTIANLQLPVVPRVTFYNSDGRRVAHLGVGGYVGYRIDSYTMVKYGRDNKVRDHDRYFLNDIRYGLMAHLGILRTNFFVKYDLNPVFQTGKGPDVRTLSFGVTL
jgi:hypothetical protein